MHFLRVSLLSLFLSSTALGNISFKAYDDIFGILLAWFQTGTNVKYDEAKGFYSGRCYYVDTRRLADASLLGIARVVYPNDNGPAFPPTVVQKIVELGAIGVAANYFDNFTYFQAQQQIGLMWDKYSPLQDFNGTISSVINQVPPTTLAVKKNGNYLVMVLSANSDGVLVPRNQKNPIQVLAGQVWGMCYYFKNIQ